MAGLTFRKVMPAIAFLGMENENKSVISIESGVSSSAKRILFVGLGHFLKFSSPI
jgi:hypothetical protein